LKVANVAFATPPGLRPTTRTGRPAVKSVKASLRDPESLKEAFTDRYLFTYA